MFVPVEVQHETVTHTKCLCILQNIKYSETEQLNCLSMFLSLKIPNADLNLLLEPLNTGFAYEKLKYSNPSFTNQRSQINTIQPIQTFKTQMFQLERVRQTSRSEIHKQFMNESPLLVMCF